jgi:hypothetical protein
LGHATSALSGGKSHCETNHDRIPPLPGNGDLEAISLLLCKDDQGMIIDSLRHIAAISEAQATILVKHADFLTESSQVMNYIADVVALLQRYRIERGVRTLYTTLSFHAVPLLAANLHPYVVDRVRFMEYRSDLREQNPTAIDTYSQLSL